jgi:hypothetical protein
MLELAVTNTGHLPVSVMWHFQLSLESINLLHGYFPLPKNYFPVTVYAYPEEYECIWMYLDFKYFGPVLQYKYMGLSQPVLEYEYKYLRTST